MEFLEKCFLAYICPYVFAIKETKELLNDVKEEWL